MICLDTSVVIRYLVGSPAREARRAGDLIDGPEDLGLPLVTLVETAHVLRSVYGVADATIVDALLALVQRDDVHLLELKVGDLIRGSRTPEPAPAARSRMR